MPKVKRYTKEQEELILKNAYKKGVKLTYQEMADMFGRTVEGIRKKELDLKRKHLHGKRANNDTWTEKEEEIIKEHLQKEDFNVTTLVRILKRDVRVVEAKTLDLSIELKNGKEFLKGGRTWTKEEEEYLKKNYGIERPVLIGIYLGRSLESLHQKAKRMKLGNKKIFYTARECAAILGMSDSRFLHYVHNKTIKSRKAVTEQLIHQIKIEDLYEFMEKHQDKWDSRNMAYEPFLIEKPQWYIDKCIRDNSNPVGYLNPQKKWTEEEVNTLYSMRENGASYKEIAKALDRKVSSVENRWRKRHEIDIKRKTSQEKNELKKQRETLNRLIEEMENEKAYLKRKAYKIKPRSITEDDIEFMSNLRMVGYSSKEMAGLLECHDRYVGSVLQRHENEEYVVYISSRAGFNKQEELFKMANEGYSMYELCLEFNKSYPELISYYKAVLKEKEKVNYIDGSKVKTWTKEDEEKLMKWREKGLTLKEISVKLGKSVSSVKSRISVINNRNKKANNAA